MNGILDMEWEIVNQAYVHKWYGYREPHINTEDAISHWVETATCVAVTLEGDMPRIIAPHGIDDLVNLVVRPSPSFIDKPDVFFKRVRSKKWLEKWPKLRVIATDSAKN